MNEAVNRRVNSIPHIADMSDILSTDDIATMFGITHDWALRWLRSGKVPGARKVGRFWYVSRPIFEREFHGMNAS